MCLPSLMLFEKSSHKQSENAVEDPFIEIVSEEYLEGAPVSSIQVPRVVREIERFTGSRWRFAATLSVLTLGGLLVRENSTVRGFFAHFTMKTAQAEETLSAAAPSGPCPEEMALVTNAEKNIRVCVDKWEASLVEIQENGEERLWSPYLPVDDGHVVKAVSKAGVIPQGYIDRDSAQGACESAGKRLCQVDEWMTACQGPDKTLYPYGNDVNEAACNIHGKSPLGELFSASFKDYLYDFRVMNDPSLNALDGTVAKTGSFKACVNGYGIHDIVGNLHEWTADKNGAFRGGYYQDGHKNGEGCKYVTSAHGPTYHDYSTGFRCCKDAE
jgi:formylglycine-generating enzyme